MYRLTRAQCGIFSVLAEELKKLPAYLSYKASESSKLYVDSASKAIDFLKGEDPNENPEMRDKRRRHREMYQSVLREQSAKAQEEAAQKHANLPWKEKLRLSFKEAKESVAQMTSAKAGVMALLQHCTASHAAEVALEQGIDVKNVQMVFEKAAANNSVGYEEVVVGYIDAPASSREEVMAFAEKLHKACPVAQSMHIEWRQGSAAVYRQEEGSVRRAEELQREIDESATGTRWDGIRTGSSNSDPSLTAEGMPAGMPGSRRIYSRKDSWGNRDISNGRLRDDDNELCLTGLKKMKTRSIQENFSRSDAKYGSTETTSAFPQPSAPHTPVTVEMAQPASRNNNPGVPSSPVKPGSNST